MAKSKVKAITSIQFSLLRKNLDELIVFLELHSSALDDEAKSFLTQLRKAQQRRIDSLELFRLAEAYKPDPNAHPIDEAKDHAYYLSLDKEKYLNPGKRDVSPWRIVINLIPKLFDEDIMIPSLVGEVFRELLSSMEKNGVPVSLRDSTNIEELQQLLDILVMTE